MVRPPKRLATRPCAAKPIAMPPMPPKARIPEMEKPSVRSEEHTSELQSLMRISYAVFCLKKKKQLSENILNYICELNTRCTTTTESTQTSSPSTRQEAS